MDGSGEAGRTALDIMRRDRELFSSLLRHIVQARPDEDPTEHVLEAVGRNIGADRCYVYRFWDPGKSSMCTNTHEWCSEGVQPEIHVRQACNLADLVEFNARITSGRDFLFSDINDIDRVSREWLEPQGIKSLIATPLVEADGVICGFAGFDFVKAPCAEFTDQIVFNIHEAANFLLNCWRLHERAGALNLAHLKGDLVDFMFKHQGYAEIADLLGAKVCEITGAQHLVLCADDGTRTDWFSPDAPACCHDCVRAAVNFGKQLPEKLFSDDETLIIREGSKLSDMNLPRYCPMRSSVISQFRRGAGWWRLVADYTRPHKYSLPEVARGLRMALELLAMAYDREQRARMIATMQEHQRFRADTLAYALSKDDLQGLLDLMMHRLLDLTACDYIAIHTVGGDHFLLHSGGKLENSPERCCSCPFYRLEMPYADVASDTVIELADVRHALSSPLPPDCPSKSLAVAVVNSDGKPWGAIALHYLKKQKGISEDDRHTLKTAADVLTLALERHSAAVRLEAERDRAVEAEEARNYFFSSVSHDIRTPLNAIIGFSELLQAGDVPPDEAKRDLGMIVSSGRTLLQLVNDVLDLSKMDVGKLEFSFEPTDVGDIVNEIVQVFEQKATAAGQRIVAEIAPMPRLKVDPHRFRQLLFNFLGNAVKYAGPCTVRVVAAYEGGLLKLTVADYGKGVPPEKAKWLMQPFVQADIKNRSEGSGLGLAICKRLVEIVHGRIWIDTAPGKGFAIHSEVPTSVASADEKPAQETSAAAALDASKLPVSVLVVDDSPVNRAVLKAMLKKLGILGVKLAEDGKSALDMLLAGSAFDLVLTDMWMPVMDGVELVRRIRADKRLARLKVCAITADVEARADYRKQGFDAFLLKPVTLGKISELFSGLAADGK